MKKWGVLVGVFALGFAAYGGMMTFFKYTNTNEFCTSCHTMQINFNEYKETAHYQNHAGVSAGCADCHVPKEFFPKLKAKIVAAKDVYHEIMGTIDTPEKYEAYRWKMASSVWKKMEASDSRECRSCHSWEAMMFNEDNEYDIQAQDKMAAKKHRKAQEQGKTCIDCHKGIAHVEPDEPEEEEAKK